MGFKGLYQLAASLPPHITAAIFSQALRHGFSCCPANLLLVHLPPKPTPTALSPPFLAFPASFFFLPNHSLSSTFKLLFNHHFFFFFLFLFRAAPVAYGNSQGRNQIRASVAGPQHSHSNEGSLTH